MGGRDDDVEAALTFRFQLPDPVRQLVGGERLVGDDEVTGHKPTSSRISVRRRKFSTRSGL
jgi:hypothetical protein